MLLLWVAPLIKPITQTRVLLINWNTSEKCFSEWTTKSSRKCFENKKIDHEVINQKNEINPFLQLPLDHSMPFLRNQPHQSRQRSRLIRHRPKNTKLSHRKFSCGFHFSWTRPKNCLLNESSFEAVTDLVHVGVSFAAAALPFATHALVAHASAVVDFADLQRVILGKTVALYDDGFPRFSVNNGWFSIHRKCISTWRKQWGFSERSVNSIRESKAPFWCQNFMTRANSLSELFIANTKCSQFWQLTVVHNRLEIVVAAFGRGFPLVKRQLVELRIAAFLPARAAHVSNIVILKEKIKTELFREDDFLLS